MLRIVSVSVFLSTCSFALADVIDPTPWLNKTLNTVGDCSTIKTGFDARFSSTFDKEEKRHVVDFTCKKHPDCSFDWCGGEKKLEFSKNTEINKIENVVIQQPRAGLKTDKLTSEIKVEVTKAEVIAPAKNIVVEAPMSLEVVEKKNEPKMAMFDVKKSNFSTSVELSLKDKIAQRTINLNIETKKFPKSNNGSWMTFALANTQVQNVELSAEDSTPKITGTTKVDFERVIAPGLSESGMNMKKSSEKMKKLAEYQARNKFR